MPKDRDNPRPSRDPMDRKHVYFNSDRDGHLNLYALTYPGEDRR
jgi:hypothetical protein